MFINKISNFGHYGQYGQQNVKRNPDDYARRYANQNGISFEEAKTKLKSQYGDAKENSQVSLSEDFDYGSLTSNTSMDNFDIKSLFNELLNALKGNKNAQTSQNQSGLPQNQDPDSYLEEYAEENGLTTEEAKAELQAKYGDPTQPNKNFLA